MMADTKIEYSDKVLEVTGGCTKCSPGCQNCWAIKEVWRMAHNPKLGDKWKGLVEKKNGILNWTGKIKCFEDALVIPLLRRKPTRYFVDSKADLFHPKVRFKYITHMHDRIDVCQQHTFLILTKRIERAKEYYLDYLGGRISENIHLGVSISTQAEADKKIPILLQIPAAVRGLSLEPMLEGIDLKGTDKNRMGKTGYLPNYLAHFYCNDCGEHLTYPPTSVTQTCRNCGSNNYRKEQSIHWVVVGGESGPKARYCPIENIRGIVEQCKSASVPVFVKQIHLWKLNETDRLFETKNDALFYSCKILHPKIKRVLIKDINQFPEDLRIRELPNVSR